MQRGGVRATVGGVAVDIPLGTFTAGQVLRYSATGGPDGGPGIDSVADLGGDVVGPGVSVNNNVVLFNGTTGKLIKDSGSALPTGNVVGPASSVDNHLALFNSTTGKLLKDSAAIVVDASSNVSAMGTLNGRTIANWVDGPASSVDNHLMLFNGTGGKTAKDSSAVVVDASSNMSGLANVTGTRFTGPATGLRESTPTDLTMGAVLDAELLARVGTTVTGKFNSQALNSSSQVSAITTLADVTSHTYAIKAGIFTYFFRFKGVYRSDATTTGLRFTANFTGTSGAFNGSLAVITGAAGAVEYFSTGTKDTALGSGTGPGAVDVPFDFWGNIVVTGAGTFAFRIASEVAAGASVTLAARALSEVWQA